MRRVAVVMAGGSGERFWPVSTKGRPKQFLNLASPDKTLLEEAVDRAIAVAGANASYIATGRHLAEASSTACPALPPGNVWAEPTKRNTLGCLVWVAANLLAQEDDATVAVLTADQRIAPMEGFASTVDKALCAAESEGGIVVIGVKPTRPETGFGYIEVGGPAGNVHRVQRFREKPDLATAQEFLSSGRFLWNSGMFFYTLSTFMRELDRQAPEVAETTRKLSQLLRLGDTAQADELFATLPNLSIDYAMMEHAEPVFVAPAEFEWDDLGAWDALARSYAPDAAGNVVQGEADLIEANGNTVYVDGTGVRVAMLGVDDLVVVVTADRVLVLPKHRAQEVKKFLNP
ncbi:MAG: mannose-1-phosphate guanylyltransferase [Armatimonadetes bacterium]|nr:mannose-1-phosphate guanylyltransferase [Armatimonadota bacterium]